MKRREFVLAGGAGLSVLMASCSGQSGDVVDAAEVASYDERFSFTVAIGGSADEGPEEDETRDGGAGSGGDDSGGGADDGGEGESTAEGDDDGSDESTSREADGDEETEPDGADDDGADDDQGEGDENGGADEEGDQDDEDGDSGDDEGDGGDEDEDGDDGDGDGGDEDESDGDEDEDDTGEGDGDDENDGDAGNDGDGPIPGFSASTAETELHDGGVQVDEFVRKDPESGMVVISSAEDDDEVREDLRTVLEGISSAIVDPGEFDDGTDRFGVRVYGPDGGRRTEFDFAPALPIDYQNGNISIEEYVEDATGG